MKNKIPRLLQAGFVALWWISLTAVIATAALGQSESELVTAFRQAHANHDFDGMLRLFCWNHVTPEMRQMTEKSVSREFDNEISTVKVTSEHPVGRTNQYVLNGMRYGFNLPLTAELVVENIGANGSRETSYYPLGIKDGRFQIALMAPLGPAAGPQMNPGPPAVSSAASSRGSGELTASAESKKITVRSMTPLVVHIDQAVSVSLASSGGAFTATFSQPVQVGSVIVIPAGSICEGTVTREANYSPEMTLTSVNVNGRSVRLRTFPITFNEKITFPAGSEFSFHLMFSLDMPGQ